MPGPLDGVKVIELTTMITGPLAGMLLADLGAAVVKIENPDGGDPFRSFRGGRYGGHFIAYNRNKRSLTLDLRAERGRHVFRKLVRQADVLIDNFRPGVLDRLGLSYAAVAQSLSGTLSQFLDPAAPHVAGPTLADNITGHYAAYAILGALYERTRTGKGRRIETSMLESMIAFAPDAFINHQRYGTRVDHLSRVSVSQSYAFCCSDGRLIALHL